MVYCLDRKFRRNVKRTLYARARRKESPTSLKDVACVCNFPSALVTITATSGRRPFSKRYQSQRCCISEHVEVICSRVWRLLRPNRKKRLMILDKHHQNRSSKAFQTGLERFAIFAKFSFDGKNFFKPKMFSEKLFLFLFG